MTILTKNNLNFKILHTLNSVRTGFVTGGEKKKTVHKLKRLRTQSIKITRNTGHKASAQFTRSILYPFQKHAHSLKLRSCFWGRYNVANVGLAATTPCRLQLCTALGTSARPCPLTPRADPVLCRNPVPRSTWILLSQSAVWFMDVYKLLNKFFHNTMELWHLTHRTQVSFQAHSIALHLCSLQVYQSPVHL